MAALAGFAAGVIFGNHLGELLRLGRVGLMALGAKFGSVRQDRFGLARIIGVHGLGAMAGFAGDNNMFAGLEDFELILMTHFTCGAAGEGDWLGSDIVEGAWTEVTVFAEAGGDERVS